MKTDTCGSWTAWRTRACLSLPRRRSPRSGRVETHSGTIEPMSMWSQCVSSCPSPSVCCLAAVPSHDTPPAGARHVAVHPHGCHGLRDGMLLLAGESTNMLLPLLDLRWRLINFSLAGHLPGPRHGRVSLHVRPASRAGPHHALPHGWDAHPQGGTSRTSRCLLTQSSLVDET